MKIPLSVLARYTVAWTDAIEGCMAGDAHWAILAKYRCRLLLGLVPAGIDRVDEIKRRLRLWEDARFEELLDRLLGQQAEGRRKGLSTIDMMRDEEQLAKVIRKKAADEAVSKAIKGLVGGVERGTAAERLAWTTIALDPVLLS